jgi:hypothetical protein
MFVVLCQWYQHNVTASIVAHRRHGNDGREFLRLGIQLGIEDPRVRAPPVPARHALALVDRLQIYQPLGIAVSQSQMGS